MYETVHPDPTFRASLRPADRGDGTLFVAGAFDAYDLEQLTDRARRGIDSVRIVVRDIGADDARQRMSPSLERLRRHGVRVTVVAG